MKALEAKLIAQWMRVLNDLEREVDKLPAPLQDIWNTLIRAIKSGERSCIIYHLPQNAKVALFAKKFKIEGHKEEDIEYFTVVWDEDESASRNAERQNSKKSR